MEAASKFVVAIIAGLLLSGFLYWRYVWFFRNPGRVVPQEESIVSPADGTVVYVKALKPNDDVIVIKQGVRAKLEDIIRTDAELPKRLIGIFMSPFNVHYNRVPLDGTVESITHYQPKGSNVSMFFMHMRTLFRLPPYHADSMHLLQNERTVTRLNARFGGRPISCYIVQIAGRSVRGIESYVRPGEHVSKGGIFGMIRIGSQVDLVVTETDDMEILVQPGQKVKAGETILARASERKKVRRPIIASTKRLDSADNGS